MGQKDISTKKYLSNPDRFADVFNAYLFDGKQVVKASSLTDIDSSHVALIPAAAAGGSRRSYKKQKYRDLIREAVIKNDGRVTYVFLGIENQSDIHYAMPARNMLYNALSYNSQVDDIIYKNKEVPMPRKTRKGGYNMCKALDAMVQQGKEEIVFNMCINGDIDDNTAARNLELSKAAFTDKFKKYLDSQNKKHLLPQLIK